MNGLKLIRKIENESGTFGELWEPGAPYPLAVTLENRWLDNAPFLSCIPAERYACAGIDSPSHGSCIGVLDVPDRNHILFHAGNWESDTQGCILVGKRWDHPNHPTMIFESRDGLDLFMKRVQERYRTGFFLTITKDDLVCSV